MTDDRLNTQPSAQLLSTGELTSTHETDGANRKPGMSPRFSILFRAPNVHIPSPSADEKPISVSSAVLKFKNREINDNSMCCARTVLAYIWLSEFQTSVTVCV